MPLVPAAYQAVYQELEDKLAEYRDRVNTEWDGTTHPVKFATALLPADSHTGRALLSPENQMAVLIYLDKLKALGVQAVVVQINYPLLTVSFVPNAPDYAAYYAQLATEVRSRGLKFVVEHNLLLPGFSGLDPTDYYAGLRADPLPVERFGRERYDEVQAILEQIRPDYLSLVTEPGTYAAVTGLVMDAAMWKTHIEGMLTQLAVDVPIHNTLLGAGSGTWDPPTFVSAFASIPGLHYIDLHLYPLSNGHTDYLSRLLDWSGLVRSIDSSKKMVITEAWPYKASAAELGGAPIDAELLARDVWSFWQPLDELLLDALTRTAHYQRYDLIAPFWSRYFFAYLDYNDPSLAGLGALALMTRADQTAFSAMLAGRSSGTGIAFQRLATTPPSR